MYNLILWNNFLEKKGGDINFNFWITTTHQVFVANFIEKFLPFNFLSLKIKLVKFKGGYKRTFSAALLLASWFPQITEGDTNVFTTRFIT